MRARTITSIIAAGLVTGLASAACGGDDVGRADTGPEARDTAPADSRSEGAAEGHDPAASARPAEPAPEEPTADDSDVASFDVRVRQGAVVGGPRVFRARSGQTVRLSITSDAADEVHVHGVDISREIPAGRRASMTFTANDQGSFEVELHDAGTLLGTLEVR